MKVRLKHTSEYIFTDQVFLEPHTLKFIPRQDHRQKLLSYESRVNPQPKGKYYLGDEFGNQAECCWFDGKHDFLNIEVVFEIDLLETKMFDFLIYPLEYAEFPFHYDPGTDLEHYLKTSSDQVKTKSYSDELRKSNTNKTMDFLLNVTGQLHDQFDKTVRHSGPPHWPDETLDSGKGSCRDLAVLEIEILRNLGFASRFTSGYRIDDTMEEDHELHAWVEVFIPGAGWFGLDPSSGLAVGNDHVAVSSSFHPIHTMPVTGTFRGLAQSNLTTSIQVEFI